MAEQNFQNCSCMNSQPNQLRYNPGQNRMTPSGTVLIHLRDHVAESRKNHGKKTIIIPWMEKSSGK